MARHPAAHEELFKELGRLGQGVELALVDAAGDQKVVSLPMAMTTAHISRAVVRLSATGEIKKASKPVIQKIKTGGWELQRFH